MGKRKINAKELVSDLKQGLSEKQIMAKYNVSGDGLKSLLKKLMDAGLLTQDDLRARKQAQARNKAAAGTAQSRPQQVNETPPAAAPPAPPAPAAPQTVDKETALAIAEQIKSGDHDNSIMSRFELTPGKLKAIKAELVELGYLPRPEEQSPPSAGPTPAVCPSCGVSGEPGEQTCVYCGADMGGQDRTPLPSHGFRTQDERDDDFEEEDEKICPWEDRASYGTLNAFIQTATNCLFNPTYFFSHLPTRSGYGDPILFGIFATLLGVIFAFLWSKLYYGVGGLFVLLIAIVLALVGATITIPIWLLVWSGLVHLGLSLVGGAKEGFQATFRSVSYSSVANSFNAIPVVGSIASLWSLVLTVIGLRETHKTSTGKSIIAVVIPLILVVLIAVGAFLKLRSAFFSAVESRMGVTSEYSGDLMPEDLCVALDDFFLELDMATGGADVDLAKTRIQKALQDLAVAARSYGNDPDVRQFISRASFYAVMSLAEMQGQSVPQDRMDSGREALLEMCGE
jgi:hypothetical protein